VQVVGIKFDYNSRLYYYSYGDMVLKKGMRVLCDRDSSLQCGTVKTDSIDVEPSKMGYAINPVIRALTNKDINVYDRNSKDAKNALRRCRELVNRHKLDMKIVGAYYTFNREQLMFFFFADSRVDFRDLARELASIYKTRIELRQIGVRDKAGLVGGLGICGCELCCSRFLNDFDSVSINMAKNQNIALNPTKINGVCGRLLCCLKYEDNVYKENRKGMPKLGKMVETEKGIGKVISVDILSRTYVVEVNGNNIEVKL